MSDYDLLQLFETVTQSSATSMDAIITAVFAYIVACFFAARRLNYLGFVSITFIYLCFVYVQLLGLFYALKRTEALITEAASRPYISNELNYLAQSNVAATEAFTPAIILFWIFVVVISILFGVFMKMGKLEIK